MPGSAKTPEPSPEALDTLLAKDKTGQVAAFFEGMEETTRRALAPRVIAYVRANAEFSVDTAARMAVLATASFAELKKLGWQGAPPMCDDAAQALCLSVLRERAPDWIDRWADWLLEDNFRHWRFVRRMIRENLCQQPDSEIFVLGMIEGLRPSRDERHLADAILADREMLEGPFWRLFEVEGGGELSLAACDKYTTAENSWATALCDLARRGELDRDRLLDASLSALTRDFAQFRAGWFSRFHESLKPTLDERTARANRYLDLLASPIPPTVSFAMKALAVLHRAKRLDGAAFISQAEPVLYAKAKGPVKQALRLMSAFATAESALAIEAARIAATGLEHPDPEVQESAHALIAKFGDVGDQALRRAVRDRADLVAAPLKPRIAEWLGGEASDDAPGDAAPAEDSSGLIGRAKALTADLAKAAGVDSLLTELDVLDGAIAPLRPESLHDLRMSAGTAVDPVASLDDLIALFLRSLETPDDVEQHERLLDGLTQLGNQRPDDFEARTRPLAKRVATLRDRGLSHYLDRVNPGWLLIDLADAWLLGQPLEIEVRRIGEPILRGTSAPDTKTPLTSFGIGAIFLLRAADATRFIAAGKACRLLSIPTHRGGLISPLDLVARSQDHEATGAVPSLADQVLALLRLCHGGRAAALSAARDLQGEWGAALRYALGGDAAIGDTAALWVAASRTRAPHRDDPDVEARFPGLGPDGGRAATLDYYVTSRTEEPYTWHYFNIECDPAPPKKLPLYRSKEAAIAASPVLMPTVIAHRHTDHWWCFDRSGRKIPDALTTNYANSPWGRLLWPVNPEVLFASTASDTAQHLDEPRPVSEPPYDGYRVAMQSDVPLTRMGRVMVCLGLNARDAAEGQLATDLLIAAIDDGRLDGQSVGAELRQLLFSGMCKPKRWAQRLDAAAQVSSLHAATVRHVLEVAIQADSGIVPRDVHALAELLYGLCVELGEAITIPETRNYLAGFSGGSKAARLAKKLLALEENAPQRHRRAAAARALAGRIKRAERWAGPRET